MRISNPNLATRNTDDLLKILRAEMARTKKGRTFDKGTYTFNDFHNPRFLEQKLIAQDARPHTIESIEQPFIKSNIEEIEKSAKELEDLVGGDLDKIFGENSGVIARSLDDVRQTNKAFEVATTCGKGDVDE